LLRPPRLGPFLMAAGPARAMARTRRLEILSAVVLSLTAPVAFAGHPCEAEVASACPDRAGSEMAVCLKNPDEHESKTTLSSECTDFIALNNACSEDISKFCDENFFGEDTTLCLTQWTQPEDLSEKCRKVIAWAVPKSDEDEEDVERADQNGMTEKDHREKMEWREKRKAARGDAIERMKMKERDRKKEEDRVALETFKKERPEEYAAMIQQQEEEKRQQAEFKRRERARAAAIERQKKQAAGAEEEEENGTPKAAKKKGKKSKGMSSLLAVACICGVCLLIFAAYFYLSKKSKAPTKDKKKRK